MPWRRARSRACQSQVQQHARPHACGVWLGNTECAEVAWHAGSLLWILEAPSHKDYDGYAIYMNGTNSAHQPQRPFPIPPLPPCAAPGLASDCFTCWLFCRKYTVHGCSSLDQW